MNNFDIAKFYSEKINLYHFIFYKIFRYHSGIKAFFKNNNFLRPDIKILDAGCGSGLVTKVLYQNAKNNNHKNVTFTAFDISPTMIDKFNNWLTNNDNINNIILKNINILDFDELHKLNSYDLIISSAMLEYIPKKQIFLVLKSLKNHLNQNGKLIFMISKDNLLNKILIKKWWKANLYTKNEIKIILNEAGFKNIEFLLFPAPYSYLNYWGFIIKAE